MKVLIAGESWMTHSIHVKGFDSFTTSSYNEGVGPLKQALLDAGHDVEYLPNHLAPNDFPTSIDKLSEFNVVLLSDIGVNTLLLPDRTFVASKTTPNRLKLLHDYVHSGRGLVMIGGYLTFQGIEGKAGYHGTPVEEVLPVDFYPHDDRRELPEGIVPEITEVDHEITRGLTDWPHFLGYNRAIPKADARVLATVAGDPFIAVMNVGQGRSAIFASDCGPHWGPPEFLAWQHYATLWQRLVSWVGAKR
jgi:uncharacterized membrane protein